MTLRQKDLENVFLTKEANEKGFYVVRFFFNGRPRVVVVDDLLPAAKRDPPVPCKWIG